MRTSPQPDATEPPLWRTLASFLLFLQLFAVTTGVLSNESPSSLEWALRNNIPGLRPYLQTLLMDLSYAYVLTYGASAEPTGDSQCWIEADLTLPDDTKQTVVLPPTVTAPQRFKHYEMLARRALLQVGNPTLEGVLPQGVARALVAETGATGGVIRLRWRPLPENAQQAAVQDITTYEARILVNDGVVELFKIEAAANAAPKAASKTGPQSPIAPTKTTP